MKDYAIIYNPTAAAGRIRKQMSLARKYLDEQHINYDLFETQHSAHAIELAMQVAKDGYRVIAAGGDGTCNEVLNGVMKSQTNALFGMIPMGTGNDIPGAIGYRPDIRRAVEIIAQGTLGRNDVGRATNAVGEQRYFLGIGSQGFDAEVTKRTNEAPKRLPGTWNYIASVVKTVFGFKKRMIRCSMDSDHYEGVCNLIAVANGKSYGGWMYMAPRACSNDGIFHLSIPEMGTVELLRKFKMMYDRTLHPDPHIKEYCSKHIKIEMVKETDEPYLAQVDGELIGPLPVEYECLQLGYEFIRPSEDEAEAWFMEKYGKRFKEHLQKLKQQGSAYY